MKKKLLKILLSMLAYVVFTTLFAMQLLVCSAQNGSHKPALYPVYPPCYAMLVEYLPY